MADLRGSGCVGRASFAGFVGEYASFEAHKYRGADHSARCLLEAEGAFDNEREYGRDAADVGNKHVESDSEVAQGHKRHDDGAYAGDAGDAAEDHYETEYGQGYRHCHRRYAEGVSEGCGDGVGLDHIVGEAELAEYGYREYDGEPAFVQAFGDIVRRASDV